MRNEFALVNTGTFKITARDNELSISRDLTDEEYLQLRGEFGLEWRSLTYDTLSLRSILKEKSRIDNRPIRQFVVENTLYRKGAEDVEIVTKVTSRRTHNVVVFHVSTSKAAIEEVLMIYDGMPHAMMALRQIAHLSVQTDQESLEMLKELIGVVQKTDRRLIERGKEAKAASTDAKSEEKVEESQPATPSAADAKSEEKVAAPTPTPQQGEKKLAPPPNPQGGGKQARGGAKLAPPPNPQGGGKSVDKKPTKPAEVSRRDNTPHTMDLQMAKLAVLKTTEPTVPTVEPEPEVAGPVATQTEAPAAPVTPES